MKGPGGDALRCKPLSQSLLCWVAKLRGVGFTLRDRTHPQAGAGVGTRQRAGVTAEGAGSGGVFFFSEEKGDTSVGKWCGGGKGVGGLGGYSMKPPH